MKVYLHECGEKIREDSRSLSITQLPINKPRITHNDFMSNPWLINDDSMFKKLCVDDSWRTYSAITL